MLKRIPLHISILLGLALGVIWAIISVEFNWDPTFTAYYIKPFGDIFLNLLKMIALPLVLASLIEGIANLHSVKKLSRMGGKTLGIYVVSTVIAISIGLFLANFIEPGKMLPENTREELMGLYKEDTEKSLSSAAQVKDSPPLKPLVDIVPENIFYAASSNSRMLQIVFFGLLFGIALLKIPREKANPVVKFFEGINEAVVQIVNIIMKIAPIGVFALIAGTLIEMPGQVLDVLYGLSWYVGTVLLGLLIMALVVYPAFLRYFTEIKYGEFFNGIRDAQLLAFSTSSSSATLPVTKKKVEENLGVSEEASSFVLPLGATINMDGTSLYQGIAAVFIAQAMNVELSIAAQLTIVLTALLASIGSAGVPGAGIVMLVIVLEAIGVPSDAIALIMGVDRILDMCRTTVNVTGDSMVASVIARSEGQLHRPKV